MTRPVRFLPRASEELDAAAGWYETQRSGLGIELVAEVDSAIDRIAARPAAFPLWRNDRVYRRCVLERFPYVLFFRVLADDSIEITAVAHGRRRPGYWRNRR